MKTILSAALALSVLSAIAVAPASAKSHPDPRNPAVEIPDHSQY
jgi:hypothetical protein